MDTRTGEIVQPEDFDELVRAVAKGRASELQKQRLAHLREMKLVPTVTQMRREPPRVGKYDPCPCGSGKKFKWCCFERPAKT